MCAGLGGLAGLAGVSAFAQATVASHEEWCLQVSAGELLLRVLSEPEDESAPVRVPKVESIQVLRHDVRIGLRIGDRVVQVRGVVPASDGLDVAGAPTGIVLAPMVEVGEVVPEGLSDWLARRQQRLGEIPWVRCFESRSGEGSAASDTGVRGGDDPCEQVRKGGSHGRTRPAILPVGTGTVWLTYLAHAALLAAAVGFLVVRSLRGPRHRDD